MKSPVLVSSLLLAGVALSSACGGGGRYGYARTYSTWGEEASFARRAQEPVYDEVRRMPHQHFNQLIAWFGVVTAVEPGAVARVAMQVRTHQERHLCEEAEEETCRVTVSEQNGGPFTALLRLSPEDAVGENRVQTGSLVRVFGTLVQGEYDSEGGPVLRAEHYRHWPRGQFVTTEMRNRWRR